MNNSINSAAAGFLGNILNNPAMLQKALMSGLLGPNSNLFSNPVSNASYSKNGAYLGASAPTNYGAYDALSGGQNALSTGVNGQSSRHRCNLNLEEHQKYADALVSAGIIDENTGKSIKQKMAAVFRAENGLTAGGGAENPYFAGNTDEAGTQGPAAPTSLAESEFLKARECLLDYLKNLDIELTSDDLAKIEAVVLELEKLAISRNTQGLEGNNTLENPYESALTANEAAKERLMSANLGSKGPKGLPQKTFTREEIAKMSTAEFIKNEPQINYQLQNGLL